MVCDFREGLEEHRLERSREGIRISWGCRVKFGGTTPFAIVTLGGRVGFVYVPLSGEILTTGWNVPTIPLGTLAVDVKPSSLKNKSFLALL